MSHLSIRLLTATLALCALDASAIQQRSFVASYGSDANSCALLSPCRSFNAAIAQTLAGGEVVILDTGGYGAMTITKSIKVIGPTGVYGGISVAGGAGATTGVTINAGANDVVTLRGLDISGVPGAPPLPLVGIDIVNIGTLHIEKTSIGNFTQDTSACVRLDTASAVQVYINDSLLRECRSGISLNGSGATSAERPLIEIDNTRIEHSINTVASGVSALRLTGNFAVALRNSIVAGAGDGIFASNNIATASSRVYVINSHITRANNAAIETAGGNAASLLVNVTGSVLNVNDAAILFGHGAVRLSTSVITNNTNSIVNCGGVSTNVQSLALSAGVGSNLIADSNNSVLPVGCTAFITPTLVSGQ